jgi:hypothetical protein
MRVLRIAPTCQLALFAGRAGPAAGQWHELPEQARAEVLALLARIIARGVLASDGQAPVPAGEEGRGD